MMSPQVLSAPANRNRLIVVVLLCMVFMFGMGTLVGEQTVSTSPVQRDSVVALPGIKNLRHEVGDETQMELENSRRENEVLAAKLQEMEARMDQKESEVSFV